MKYLFIIWLSLTSLNAVFSQKTQDFYYNSKDSTSNLYTIILPKENPLGVLFLLPAYGEGPYNVLEETDIWKIAYKNKLIVVIPLLQNSIMSFYIDDASQQTLTNMIKDVINKYDLKDKKLYIGGFSLGGSGAIKYGQRSSENSTIPKPNAIFAIDPPLDFERLYNSMDRNIKNFPKSPLKNESIFFLNKINTEFGGTPQNSWENYKKLSPYLATDTTQFGIKKVIKMPIALFNEPDIQFNIKSNQTDYYSSNVLDCAAFINELLYLGSQNATLFITTGKGYRKSLKKRSTHAWSIADAKTTIEWLLKF